LSIPKRKPKCSIAQSSEFPLNRPFALIHFRLSSKYCSVNGPGNRTVLLHSYQVLPKRYCLAHSSFTIQAGTTDTSTCDLILTVMCALPFCWLDTLVLYTY